VESGGVDDLPVGRDRQRARRVREEVQDRERRAAQRGVARLRVEDPDVGPADARRGELRIVRGVLPAVGGRDEGPVAARAGEDDVARLISHQERAGDPSDGRPSLTLALEELDDAHAVGEVIDHPGLLRRAGRDGDGLQPDRHRAPVTEPLLGDPEHFQTIVRRVHREQRGAVGRQGQGPDGARFEQREGRRGRRSDAAGIDPRSRHGRHEPAQNRNADQT
jgi:hypothetical protein